MPRFEKLWIGALVGFLTGVLLAFFNDRELGETLFAGLFAGLLGVFLNMIIFYPIHMVMRRNMGFLSRERKFISTILMLVAEMIKMDLKAQEKSTKVLKENLRKNFDEKQAADYLKQFETYMHQKIDVKQLCKVIDYDFDDSMKAHLIYLLASIAVADRLLTNAEIKFLKGITRRAKIRPASLMSALNQFNFIREKTYQEKSREKARTQKRSDSQHLLKKAYEILGIDASANEKEIKTAYRKLVKIYHPDRVNTCKIVAKEKFQVLTDAYDLIKTKKGIA